VVRLEDLTHGTILSGLIPTGAVSIVSVKWFGTDALELTYKDAAGRLGSELLFRDREPTLEIVTAGRPWSFDADGALFRLVSEAQRIHLAHLFDPLVAVHSSLVEPLPHQITAVYGEMLSRQPLRFLLADDPGAGKTIMTGLFIKELLIRGDLQRCLIVCPGSLVEQWQDELSRRFGLPFEILTNDKLESARTGNWFHETPLAIARLDKLSRDENVQAKLEQTDWDLVVCDEAHKMSAHFFSGEASFTKRYRLGQLLGEHARHFLLLTATPHSGKEEDFQLFMALLDADRFEGRFRDGVHTADTSDLMRRLVKEDLVRFDGTPLFPERIAYTVNCTLSDAEADQAGVSPGSDALRDLFEMFGPCLVLIDEWVAFVRQLYGVDGLAAGSFDANLTFAQSLTEAARQVSGTLVVASIPSSDIEIGGQGGREALDRLRNTFGRMESPWRPASAEEGFEIVRRRLFEPIVDPNAFAQRDAAVRGFMDLYRSQAGEFPPQCREGDYERRLRDAYPVHPELFDRLYTDWSTLDKFQRTRGVLRLMAAVIHTLWMRQDTGLLILPASVPVDDPAVQFELTRYMEDPWVPVIEKDIDGPNALPLRLDGANPNFGRYSACRRVARTLYLGSAPTLHTARRGLEDRSIKLGCTQPGESVATFGDALRRLSDEATHLYVDAGRYWFSTQQNVNRTAADRAAQQDPDEVAEEIRRRVRESAKQRGDFARVHPCPNSGADVPDDHEARLVILGPEHAHAARSADSPARQAAAVILDARGAGPRLQRNALVFLAPDRTRLAELDQAVRQYLAWTSIDAERETLNLDAFQAGQARTKVRQMDETVDRRLPETYSWLLTPAQDVGGPLEWEEMRLQGDEPLATRASKKLKNEGRLITQYGWANLRLELDRIPLWRGDHVTLRQLWDDFAQYLYLPRLRDSEVLLLAVQEGVARMLWESESFAYAERWDDDRGRYLGLRAGEIGSVLLEGGTVVVKPEAARRQIDADEAVRRQREGASSPHGAPERPAVPSVRDGEGVGYTTALDQTSVEPTRRRLGRFHGSVALNPQRASRDAGAIAEEVLAHLTGLVGAKAEVTLEIHVDLPDDVPDHVVRTVTENCHTLKFTTFGFEER
jgi:hypothetical protein